MSIQKELEIEAVKNIYTGKKRRQFLSYSIPENGINKGSSILLLISGFGANINSNVYKKMRRQFSDQYNMVVLQTEYFGNRFMNHKNKYKMDIETISKKFPKSSFNEITLNGELNYEKLVKYCNNNNKRVPIIEIFEETLDEYNDMGLMQSIDNANAILYMLKNEFESSPKQIIAYGHSHGAYLAFLLNGFFPGFTDIIVDNSAWIFPRYIDANRGITKKSDDNIDLLITQKYMIKDLDIDRNIYNLDYLYRRIENKAQIITFQGEDDNLVKPKHKERLLKKMKGKEKYILVTKDDVDKIKFFSSNHGLNADFLKLFDYTIKNFINTNMSHRNDNIENTISTKKHNYSFKIHEKNIFINIT